MKIGISGNEWWPVLEVEEDTDLYEDSYEISQEEYDRYKAALREWNAVQAMLKAKMDINENI